ncbi:MAG: OmpH family outer membrane protein [Bacteroidales bacterium]|nr:OmpH family outer membrane protein [Bacteroidales bacterium]
MKRTIKLLALAVVLVFSLNTAMAQRALKIGHFNSSLVIPKLPDYEKAQNEFKSYGEQLQNELEAMAKEVERLQSDYETKKDQLSDLLKQNKEKEIQDAYTRYQTFRQNSQMELEQKNQDLMKSIYDKVKAAVTEVAKNNKYDYILESNPNAGMLWYTTDSDDVTSLIEKQLGIK